jgi:hypothetical protein
MGWDGGIPRTSEKDRKQHTLQKECSHKNVRVTGTYQVNSRTDLMDNNGYTVRYLGCKKEGRCLDCNALVEESEIGSGIYVLTPLLS